MNVDKISHFYNYLGNWEKKKKEEEEEERIIVWDKSVDDKRSVGYWKGHYPNGVHNRITEEE